MPKAVLVLVIPNAGCGDEFMLAFAEVNEKTDDG